MNESFESPRPIASESDGRALKHLNLLAEASRIFAESSLSLDKALQTIAHLVAHSIGDFCVIRLISPDGQWLVPCSFQHRDAARLQVIAPMINHSAMSIDDGINGAVFKSGKSVARWFGSREEARYSISAMYRKYVEECGLAGLVVCPLISRGQSFGTLTVMRDEGSPPFSNQETRLFMELAGRAAVTIENAKLLEKSEAAADQLHLLTDAIPAQIAYVDSQLIYRLINAQYERNWGTPRDQIIGRPVEQLLGPESFQKALPYIKRALAGEKVRYDMKLALPDAQLVDVDISYVPDRRPDGSIPGFFTLVTDITERKRDEAKLKEALRAREELMNVCSHEFKTPLTGMSLQIQMACDRLQNGDLSVCDPPKVRKMLENYDKQIDRLIRLVNDMLDLTRINSGKMALQLETVNLASLVYEVLDRFSGQLSASGCEVNVKAAPSVTGHWDRYRIEQVIINLLTNSMRYGQSKPITIRLEQSEGKAILRVRDQGIGIAPEDHERIFLRFERAVSSNDVSGLGLGLFIAREIVLAHQGMIRVASTLGQGAEFIVELPAQPAGH